ncbi:MAG TPA: NAD(P)-dependent oxidoreductase [Spirochaetia bacterium]|nr:NAD(P)-dependent oxidoreductase [Spirochaetia bacterium]
MSETVLLTGASGRIGRRVIPLLLNEGFRVRALIHRRALDSSDVKGVEEVSGDILDQDLLKQAIKGCSFITHLAAAWDMFPPAVHERENNQLFESVIRGTYNLLEAARGAPGLKGFLYASTDAVYATGSRRFSAPIDEMTPLVPSRFYAAAKIVCESMMAQYGALYGLPQLIVRICWCLEPAELLRLFTYEFWEGALAAEERDVLADRLAGGRGLFAPLHADGSSAVDHVSHPADIASGIVAAIKGIDRALGGIFNLAGPRPFRYLELVPSLADRLGLPWASARVTGIEPYELKIDRARTAFGYEPLYPAERMADEALESGKGHPFTP